MTFLVEHLLINLDSTLSPQNIVFRLFTSLFSIAPSVGAVIR